MGSKFSKPFRKRQQTRTQSSQKYEYEPLGQPRKFEKQRKALSKRPPHASKYRRTDASVVRLLVLEPGSQTQPIQCSLQQVALQDELDYEALSYVWGDPSITFNIECYGKVLAVTTNLHAALIRLRYLDKQRLLWIDAVCINQDDLDERGSQVQLMKEIYSRANRVLVWLGEASEKDKDLPETIQRLGPALKAEYQRGVRAGLVIQPDDLWQSSNPTDNLTVSRPTFTLLQQFYTRPFFRRLWIIQEVALAKDVITICGSWSLSFDYVSYIGLGIMNTPDLFNEGFNDEFRKGISGMMSLVEFRQDRLADELSPLHIVLDRTLEADCTDVRDHFYAILGLTDDPAALIRPNYRIDYFQTCCTLAITSIKEGKSLKLLSFCSQDPEDLDWPSWVLRLREAPLLLYDFSASRDTKPICHISDDLRTVIARGRQLDHIELVGNTSPSLDTVRSTPGLLTSFLVEYIKIAFPAIEFFSKEPQHFDREKFCRQLCSMPKTPDSSPADDQILASLLQSLNFLLDTVSGTQSDIDSIRKHEVMFWRKLTGERRFSRTTCSRLCWVPTYAAPNDIICILYGVETPYVLRPTGNGTYRLLGECYVEDLMYGEALDIEDATETDFQIW